MKKFAIGALFTSDLKRVLLFNSGETDALTNLPGDEVKPGETYYDCVSRAVLAKTDIFIKPDDWKLIGKIAHNGSSCVCLYTAILDKVQFPRHTIEGSHVALIDVERLPTFSRKDLKWIIEFAKYTHCQENKLALKLDVIL